MSWWKSLLGFENDFSKNILKDIISDPTRLITGVDPASTKLWNGVLGTDNQALVNPLGSPGQQYYDRAEANGIDTGPAQGFHKVADVVAGAFGANGLASIGGSAGAAAGGGATATGGGIATGGAAAAGGGGLLSSVGGVGGLAKLAPLAGSIFSAYSASKAAGEEADAARLAAQIGDKQYAQTREDQLRIYDQQRNDQAPYREAGTKSLAELMNGTAPGGQFTKNYERTPFEVDPGYQFRLAEGQNGIQRAAASRGGLYSGATLKALSRFNQGTAAQEYGAWDQRQNTREDQFNANRSFNRNNLASLAGIGQTATTATSNAGSNAYGTIAQAAQGNANLGARAAQDAGAARASGYVGVSNNIGSGIKQLYNNYQQQQALGSNIYVPYINGATNQTSNFDTYGSGYSP